LCEDQGKILAVPADASMRHYRALVSAAEARGWPTRFYRDLYTHDRAFCAQRDPSEPFAWALRADGTHIMGVDDRRVGHRIERAEDGPRSIERAFGDAIAWFFWDGRALLPFGSTDEIAARIAEERDARACRSGISENRPSLS